MERDTEKKLQVLHQVGKLNDSELEFVHDVDHYLEKRTARQNLADEMLLIHLSVALERVRKDGPVDEMPDDIWNQVQRQNEFNEAKKIWSDLQDKSPAKLPDSEVRYVLMHIENVIRRD